jgi:hypothetical protein
MSDYQGNIIIKNPATPTGPAQNGSAPGMWKLSEVLPFVRQGIWPTQGIQGKDTFFPYVSLLLSTTALGNANNNLFVDSSGAFNPISRNGNTTQGSVTPYGASWSNYFDGSTSYLSVPVTSSAFTLNGDFTIEAWVYRAPSGIMTMFDTRTGGNYTDWVVGLNASGQFDFVTVGGAGVRITTTETVTPNVWTHVACVRQGSTVKVYFNGVASVNTATYGTTITPASSVGYIGGSKDPLYSTGYLSNLRLVKGTAVYTANFTPPTAPLTAISGTSLLTCQSNRFRDASTNNFTITVNGNTSVTEFSPFAPAYPGISYNQSDITNWSGWFNGGTDRVQVPVTSNMYLGTTYTIEAWAYYNSTSYGARPIFSQMEPFQGGFAGLTLTLNTSGNLVAEYRPVTSGAVTTITGPTVTPYTWFHIALVSNSSSAKLYVNGTQVGSTTTFGDYPSAKTNTVAVGSWGSGWNDGGIPAAAWIGYISNLRVVKGTAVYTSNFTPPTTPLTSISGTVLLTCQNAAFTDNSTVNNILTPVSNATVTGNSPFNPVGFWSVLFNGTSNWLAASANTATTLGTGNFTIEGWFFTTSSAANQILIEQAVIDEGSGNNTGWLLYVGTTGNLVFGSAGGATYINASPSTSFLGRWTHFALVRTSTTSITLYVNGVSIGSTSTNVNMNAALDVRADTPTVIGSHELQLAGAFFNGYLSNFRIVKGTAVYTSNFTPPTSPLTAISGTGLLTLQSSRFVDNSGNNITIASTFSSYSGGSPAVQSFDPFYTSTIASNGGSMYFDGSGDYLTVPDNAALEPGSSNLTWEMWINTTNSTQYATLYSRDPASFATGMWTLLMNLASSTAGDIALYVADFSTSSPLLQTTGVNVRDGAWHHIAVVRNGSAWVLYVDGVSRATGTFSGTIANIAGGPSIGRDEFYTRNYLGYISNLRITTGSAIYTSAFTPPTAPLTPTANTTLLVNGMNAGAYDATAINNMETVGNAQVRFPTPFAPANYYAGTFDGTGDYLTVPDNAAFSYGTGDFTLECFVYASGLGATRRLYYHITTSSTQVTIYQLNTNYVGFYASNGGTPIIDILSNTLLPANAWTHIAAVRSGSTFTLYQNGVSVATGTSASSMPDPTGVVNIGALDNGGEAWLGYISNVRVVKGTAVYTANFTPSTTPLTAISGTSLLTCQNKTFIDNSANAFTVTANGNATAGAIGPFTATGGTSVYFDGTTDYAVSPSSDAFGYGTGDFTIEFWLSLGAAALQTVVSNLSGAAGTSPHIYTASGGSIRYYTAGADRITGSALSTGVWYHIAVSRASGSTRLFINGTQSGSTYADSNNYTTPSPLGIGTYWNGGSPVTTNTLNGYVDDLRITKGIARYTANFTPPTQAFPPY